MKIRQLFWALAILGSIIGGATFINGLMDAASAPQQCAAAGFALCWAALPYVFARAADEMVRLSASTEAPETPAKKSEGIGWNEGA
jgi:hypothetical protein